MNAATTLTRRSHIALWIGLAVLLAAPFIGLYPVFMMKALCYAIFACAFTIIGLQNFLADQVGSWINVIIGGIFVVCVVAFRKGFVGELRAWQARKTSN